MRQPIFPSSFALCLMGSLTPRFLPATLLVMLILLVSSPNNTEASNIGMPATAPVTGGTTILTSRPPEFAPPTSVPDIPMATASPFTSSSKVFLSRPPKLTPPPPIANTPRPTADIDGWSPAPMYSNDHGAKYVEP
uniref:Uncharacterized protein LOC105035998 n=1 Tax=Elaeis guineensis var. tenera TaxID=51953 RepID=A0A6I9QIN8_ELAGV|nr:uncharacterized protein LOC105035998 [Elaeis guineensis]